MNDLEMERQVVELDAVLRRDLWLDVDVVECCWQFAILHCGIDLTIRPDIEIRFDSVFYASMPMTWKMDTTKTVFQLLKGEDEWQLNQRFQIEQGHYLFAFKPEYLEESTRCVIAARSFTWRKLNGRGEKKA